MKILDFIEKTKLADRSESEKQNSFVSFIIKKLANHFFQCR